jgi:hypothetical protein
MNTNQHESEVMMHRYISCAIARFFQAARAERRALPSQTIGVHSRLLVVKK